MSWIAYTCRECLPLPQSNFNLSTLRFFSNKLHDLLLNMPRDTKHTQILKTQRVKIKEKSLKYPPGIVNLQILGSGAPGAPTSLYLFTDQSRYLFNCGEGAQRLAHEHKIKLSKLEHIFLTYCCWKNIGGLPGVALTLQDVGVPQIILHGPNVTDQIFPATRRFVVLKNLAIKTASCTPSDVYEDSAIKVNYIPLVAAREKRLSTANDSQDAELEDETDYYEHEKKSHPAKRNRKRSSSDEPASKKLPQEDVSMCYAVRLHPKPGALCLEKCVEAGVPPGPLLGRLKAGEDIVLNDGTIVRSADVTLAHDPGPIFLVVDVPSEKFLPSLESSFTKYQTSDKEEDVPYVIVHFTPPHIMSNSVYKNWMEKFHIGSKHLLMNTANSCLGSTAVHRIQYKLNLIEPNLFPLLKDPGFSQKQIEDVNSVQNGVNKSKINSQCLIIKGVTRSKIGLRPRKDSGFIESLEIEPESYLAEAKGIDGFSEELSKLKSTLNNFSSDIEEYPNVLFLGTGSCIPNKTRNTSAILLNISKDCSIMMDCGEGTAGQLIRHYGKTGAAEVFSRIQAIYVSHLHADHHIGLIGLLQNRPSSAPPLYLLAPIQIMTWLRLYDEYFESILNSFILVPNTDMRYDEYHLKGELRDRLETTLNMDKIETTYVRHCPNAFGVTFTSKNGWKVTYSGDTMPSESLIQMGNGSDLLIHEATMEDELADEAKAKMHCTTSEAIEVGKHMKAKHVILTHFSQRYAKLPRIVGDDLGENIGVAFDNMKVRFGDLPKLKYLYPVLKLIFREDIEDLEEKAYKRQLRQEREKR